MSAVPAALDGLVDLFTRDRVSKQVVDGPTAQDIKGDVVAVGVSPLEPADVESSETPAGPRSVSETFDVVCVARSWSGNDSLKAQRTRTYALISAVKKSLKDNPTLGGAVFDARFVGSSYLPWRTDQGQLVVDVPFRIRVRAFS